MVLSNNISGRKEVKTTKCPLCGGPNQCALAADPEATECWCDSVVFPVELIARIPDEKTHKVCVCQNCLTLYLESAGTSDHS